MILNGPSMKLKFNIPWIIVLSCASIVIVVALCLAAAISLSWRVAEDDALDELNSVNQQAIARANHVYQDVTDNLRSLNENPLQDCSEAHIAEMRQRTANDRYIAGIAYFRDGVLQCSGWGTAGAGFERCRVDYVTEHGIGICLNLRPQPSNSAPRIGMSLNDYGIAVDPAVLLDSFTKTNNQLAIATRKDFILATRNNPDRALLKSLLNNPASGVSEQYVYSTVVQSGVTAVAMKPRRDILASFNRQALMFVPSSLIVAIFPVAWIISITRKRLSPLGRLKVAVRRHRFVAHYQPIIDIQTGVCVGAEALVRLLPGNGKIVLPTEFIGLAETSGLILPITDQVIDCVISDLGAALRADGSMHITINLSASDVSTGRFIDMLAHKLNEAGVRKEQIWLEVTERGFIDIESARGVFARAREQGFVIAIDDFGTGFSNLQYLESLTVDVLKIDKSFVDTVQKRSVRSPILPHIIEIAHQLNLLCIAEGVETEAQLKYLRGKGVRKAQGWLFSKPLPPKEFVAFYESRKSKLGNESMNRKLPRCAGDHESSTED